MANSMNVTTGKPRIGGAVYRAPLGTALPTNAVDALDAAFVDLGFISEDGVTSSNSRESEEIKAWGGTTVLTSQTDYQDTWQAVFIESMNIDVLKMVFGDANVSGAVESGITVKANAAELAQASYVFDMVLKGGVLKRVVLPVASISEIGDTTYVDNEAVGYDVTLAALPDTSENTHYEYIYKPAAPAPTTFTVTQNLENVTSSYSGATVQEGESFTATLTADSGYTLDAVTVEMGGTDITATAYDNGTVTINAVTGNIVITATAS